MKKPEWPQKGTSSDEQETVFTNQDNITPPTLPMGDQGGIGSSGRTDPGFVRTVHSDVPTPPPYQQPGAPFESPGYQAPSAPEGQTMLISERPTPVFAWLVVLEGPSRADIGKVHTMHPDTTTLGRVQGNSIALSDETASAQHARVRVEAVEGGEAAYVLYDMGSRNGTYVGDRETYKDDESRTYRHELQDGDYILVGETTLVFKRI
jgi:hypothetical protein